jgi:hypothetical protein
MEDLILRSLATAAILTGVGLLAALCRKGDAWLADRKRRQQPPR